MIYIAQSLPSLTAEYPLKEIHRLTQIFSENHQISSLICREVLSRVVALSIFFFAGFEATFYLLRTFKEASFFIYSKLQRKNEKEVSEKMTRCFKKTFIFLGWATLGTLFITVHPELLSNSFDVLDQSSPPIDDITDFGKNLYEKH